MKLNYFIWISFLILISSCLTDAERDALYRPTGYKPDPDAGYKQAKFIVNSEWWRESGDKAVWVGDGYRSGWMNEGIIGNLKRYYGWELVHKYKQLGAYKYVFMKGEPLVKDYKFHTSNPNNVDVYYIK